MQNSEFYAASMDAWITVSYPPEVSQTLTTVSMRAIFENDVSIAQPSKSYATLFFLYKNLFL